MFMPAVGVQCFHLQGSQAFQTLIVGPDACTPHMYNIHMMSLEHVQICCYCCQVPFTLKDEDISEDWECKDNKWDRTYAACTMAQALTDEEIDGILAGQQDALEARPLPPAEPEAAEADAAE